MPQARLQRRLGHAMVLGLIAATGAYGAATAKAPVEPTPRIAMRARAAEPSPTPPPPPPPPAPTAAPVTTVAYVDDGSIVDIIRVAALRYGASPAQMIRVASCESGLNPGAYNPRSGATGLFQFMPATFYGNGGRDIWSARDQADVAARMFAAGRASAWACR